MQPGTAMCFLNFYLDPPSLHGKMLLSYSWDFQHLMTNELSKSESVTRRIIGNLQEDKQLTICY